jgi:hypothetical protein
MSAGMVVRRGEPCAVRDTKRCPTEEMQVRLRVALAILSSLACLSPGWSQAKLNDKLVALCTATVAALQKTEAPPVVDILSGQTSSLLVLKDQTVTRWTKSKLKPQATWAEAPALTAAANITETKAIRGADATVIDLTVDDGGKLLRLQGIALIEGGKGRWLMLAVVPKEPDAGAEAAQQAVTAHLEAFRQDLVKGKMDEAVKCFGPESFSFSVSGPDFGFYAYPTPGEVRAFLMGQATAAGPLVIPAPKAYEVEMHGPVALAQTAWDITVAGFPNQPTAAWFQLYKEGEAWLIAGGCGLRVD